LYNKPISRKTEVVSLRISSDKVDTIRKLAASRKVSFNVLVNQILDEYFDFNVYAKSAGYITLPRKTVISLLELADTRGISDAGSPTRMVLSELVYLIKGRFTLQSFMNTFFAWLRDSRFAYSDHFENGIRTVSVNHNMGEKWSLLLKDVVGTILDELQVPVKFEVLPNIVVFSIQENRETDSVRTIT
jgi:hypothetical protein